MSIKELPKHRAKAPCHHHPLVCVREGLSPMSKASWSNLDSQGERHLEKLAGVVKLGRGIWELWEYQSIAGQSVS